MNRIDAGEVNAYVPPHSRFSFVATEGDDLPGRARTGSDNADQSTVALLRSALIPSTVTQLTADPLLQAPSILEHAANELLRSYSLFVQSASLRMQRALQILQILFVVAAVGQVLALIPFPDAIDKVIANQVAGSPAAIWWLNLKSRLSPGLRRSTSPCTHSVLPPWC
jgi:hypothetical protein